MSDISYNENSSCGIQVAPGAISRGTLGEFYGRNSRKLEKCASQFLFLMFSSVWFGIVDFCLNFQPCREKESRTRSVQVSCDPCSESCGTHRRTWQVVLTGFSHQKNQKRRFDITKIRILFIWGSEFQNRVCCQQGWCCCNTETHWRDLWFIF